MQEAPIIRRASLANSGPSEIRALMRKMRAEHPELASLKEEVREEILTTACLSSSCGKLEFWQSSSGLACYNAGSMPFRPLDVAFSFFQLHISAKHSSRSGTICSPVLVFFMRI